MGTLEPALREPSHRPTHEDVVTVTVIGHRGQHEQKLHLPETTTLLEMMQIAVEGAGEQLLPNKNTPLDQLRNVLNAHDFGPIIEDLNQTLGEFLQQKHTKRQFEIELVRAIRVNTRWVVAPKHLMTPLEILDLPGLKYDPQQYTLYKEGSDVPLPLGTEIEVCRGDHFEVQKDGKYGEGEGESPLHLRGAVERLAADGVVCAAVKISSQNFALIEKLDSPSPPWGKSNHSILIAIPLDELGAVDAFYLELPYTFKDGAHPRVSGTIVSLGERRFQLVSWHYADGKTWLPGVDNLDTHLSHCRGFFQHRGATNAY